MSKILDLVPRYIKDDPVLSAFVTALGTPFDTWRGIVGQLPTYVDANSAPVAWLDPLLKLVGFPRRDDLPETTKRALIGSAFAIWVNKSTETGIETYLQAFAGIDADVVRLNTTSFLAGVNTAGDIVGTQGGGAWAFEVRVPTASGYTENEIRDFLTPVVAAYEVYTVVFI